MNQWIRRAFLWGCTLLLMCRAPQQPVESNPGLSETTPEQTVGFQQRLSESELMNFLKGSKKYYSILGQLSPLDNHYYAYLYEAGSGVHLLFRYEVATKTYVNVYSVEAGPGSGKAIFGDCNFDKTMDLLISFRTTGSYTADYHFVVLQKNGAFLKNEAEVSFPTFDPIQSVVFSRYKGPNDTFVSVEKYRWKADSLCRDTLIKISTEEYEMQYGTLHNWME